MYRSTSSPEKRHVFASISLMRNTVAEWFSGL